MLPAVLTTLLVACLIIAIEQALRPRLRQDPYNAWLAAHVYFPILRMLVLLVFVFAAYPELFGRSDLPPIGDLLAQQEAWFSQSMNVLILATLLAPLLPVVGGIPGVVLPAQGVALTALLASWIAYANGAPVVLWPGALPFAAMLAIALAAPALSAFIVSRLRDAQSHFVPEFIVLLAQLPVILVYGHALGKSA